MQRYSIRAGPKQEIKIMRPVPSSDDPWGVLAVLKGTVWEPLIPVIDGMTYSHALHGYVAPLLKVLGRPPHAQAQKVPEGHRMCVLHSKRCLGASPHCQPGPKVPDCYEAPGLESPEAQRAVALVVEAWREGRYVVVVEGEEFSF